jgi:hypothetical protein
MSSQEPNWTITSAFIAHAGMEKRRLWQLNGARTPNRSREAPLVADPASETLRIPSRRQQRPKASRPNPIRVAPPAMPRVRARGITPTATADAQARFEARALVSSGFIALWQHHPLANHSSLGLVNRPPGGSRKSGTPPLEPVATTTIPNSLRLDGLIIRLLGFDLTVPGHSTLSQ